MRRKPPDFTGVRQTPPDSTADLKPQVVRAVTVRARGLHEHDGQRYGAGETFEMDPVTADLCARRGDVDILTIQNEDAP